MDNISRQRQQYAEYESRAGAYRELMEEGRSCLEESRYEESERCFYGAMEILPGAQEPYLGLADLYSELREYQEAMRILELYESSGREGTEIEEAAARLRDLQAGLEKSVFAEAGKP